MHLLDTALIKEAMKRGEFNGLITNSHKQVVIIMTQSWCPQWHKMRDYLEQLASDNIYYFIYDQSEIFDEFRSFKETVFGNFEIPYLRFYKNGQLTATSNYLTESEFKKRLKELL